MLAKPINIRFLAKHGVLTGLQQSLLTLLEEQRYTGLDLMIETWMLVGNGLMAVQPHSFTGMLVSSLKAINIGMFIALKSMASLSGVFYWNQQECSLPHTAVLIMGCTSQNHS